MRLDRRARLRRLKSRLRLHHNVSGSQRCCCLGCLFRGHRSLRAIITSQILKGKSQPFKPEAQIRAGPFPPIADSMVGTFLPFLVTFYPTFRTSSIIELVSSLASRDSNTPGRTRAHIGAILRTHKWRMSCA